MLDIIFDVDDNFLFKTEPMLKVTPDDVYAFVGERDDDFSLCYAFFGVFNEGVYLYYEIDYSQGDTSELEAKRDEWRKVELFLLMKILDRMGIQTEDGEPPIGYYYVVKPFMEKNGFLADYEIFFN